MATVRQKKAIANLVETRGNVSKAMRMAGYDDTTAKNPKNLTESVAFKTIAEQIPDDLLLQVHLQGLMAVKVSTSFTEADQVVPDYPTRHKYLESAYKIKKVMDGENDGPVQITVVKFNDGDNATVQIRS